MQNLDTNRGIFTCHMTSQSAVHDPITLPILFVLQKNYGIWKTRLCISDWLQIGYAVSVWRYKATENKLEQFQHFQIDADIMTSSNLLYFDDNVENEWRIDIDMAKILLDSNCPEINVYNFVSLYIVWKCVF